MGLLDRDYWKNKGKPEQPKKNTNKVSPQLARKMAILQQQIDDQLKKNNKVTRTNYSENTDTSSILNRLKTMLKR